MVVILKAAAIVRWVLYENAENLDVCQVQYFYHKMHTRFANKCSTFTQGSRSRKGAELHRGEPPC